ncbi:MAG: hypothetical protein ACOYOQ_15430 [Microthrixaceae bacterium]
MSDATALRAEAAEARAEAAASFERVDTDGFVSQWASGINAQLADAKADLIEAGGVAEFPALFDVDTGEWVPSKLIDTRYGTAWALLGEDAKFTGEFVTAFPARESTMARKGYREGRAVWPAKAVTYGSGTGLAGAASVRVITVIAAPDGTPPVEVVE